MRDAEDIAHELRERSAEVAMLGSYEAATAMEEAARFLEELPAPVGGVMSYWQDMGLWITGEGERPE